MSEIMNGEPMINDVGWKRPSIDELANLEGRAERYEAETVRLENEVARLQNILIAGDETLRQAQEQTERLRVELKMVRSREVAALGRELEAYRERDIEKALRREAEQALANARADREAT